jgi:chemotaxis protein methyltransferase CheR
MDRLPMTPAVFAILAALVEERAGLHYGLDSKDQFMDRVVARAVERGHDSLLDYYYQLRYDDPGGHELQALIESLVVHETYFFRELDQLEVVSDRLAARVRDGRSPRVWSAACATGEEPLSLAMLLDALDATHIVATDISRRALERARSGRHSLRALRAEPPRGVASLWLRREHDAVIVRQDLVDRIEWRQVNLLDSAAVAALGTFDVILCRNVLIYFEDSVGRRVVDELIGRLLPDGALFVGISESLLRFGTTLSCLEQRGVFFYSKAST